MNKTDQQQLIKLCEDPQSFIDLVEDWAEHKYPDSYLIKGYLLNINYSIGSSIQEYHQIYSK